MFSLELTNALPETIAAYCYTIVLQGAITLQFGDGHEVTYTKDSLIPYTPGMAVSVVHISDDYRGISLMADKPSSTRIEKLYFDFLRLVPLHFAHHHDVAFYASQLCITPRYLSQVVRQVSGRTVIYYINQMLLMEATFLLQQTSLPIVDIADRLHFSEAASFTRFFTRLQGVNPRQFRKEKSILHIIAPNNHINQK